jgi:hypothetical protein
VVNTPKTNLAVLRNITQQCPRYFNSAPEMANKCFFSSANDEKVKIFFKKIARNDCIGSAYSTRANLRKCLPTLLVDLFEKF